MTVKNFLLGNTEFGFFFKTKGEYKYLSCGTLIDGKLDIQKEFEFDHTNRIITETGFQNGWTAYHPGGTPLPPIKFRRHFTYEDEQLKIVSELDYSTNEKLKSYIFNYSNHLISEIVEINEKDSRYSPKRTKYNYDTNSNLIEEVIYISSIGDSKTYLTYKITRNEDFRIVKIVNYNSAEHNGEVVSKQEISTKEIKYIDKEIKIIFSSPNHDNIFVTTAELMTENSEIVKSIIYPDEMYKEKIVYDYDLNNLNIISKSTIYKGKNVTEIYRYK